MSGTLEMIERRLTERRSEYERHRDLVGDAKFAIFDAKAERKTVGVKLPVAIHAELERVAKAETLQSKKQAVELLVRLGLHVYEEEKSARKA